MEDRAETWRVRAIRGATTAADDSVPAIRLAVHELLDTIELHNQDALDLTEVVSVIFSVTDDLQAIFPAAIARQRPGWQYIPLLDVQHMQVKDGLRRCIRCLIQFNTPSPRVNIHHVYLEGAKDLRPDLATITSAV